MMKQLAWKNFKETGDIKAYLEFKEAEETESVILGKKEKTERKGNKK